MTSRRGFFGLLALALAGCHDDARQSLAQPPSSRTASSVPASSTPVPSASSSGPSEGGTVFLFVKIPEAIMPIDRGKKYEDPLDDLLKQHRLGEVTGAGTGLGTDREIEYVGVDLDVTNAAQALPLVRQKLRDIGAPKGTVIEEHQGERVIEHAVW